MAKKWLGLFLVGVFALGLPATGVRAGTKDLKKELDQLNAVTGREARVGAFTLLLEDKANAKKLLEFGLPAAKKKEMSYDAAFVLGLVAAELKDRKTAEAYLRVCTDQAAKLQSYSKLRESYITLIGVFYDDKAYADAVRVCKEALELNTNDGKDRIVISTTIDRFDEVDFGEPQDGFDAALLLRPEAYELFVKATAKLGKFDQAIKLVDNLLKKNNDWIDQQLKGWVLQEAGKLEDAAKVYESVIKQVAKDDRLKQKLRDKYVERFRYEISNVYVDMKKIDRATEHLEFLVKKYPDNPVYYNDLGYIWADNDLKLAEAEKLIRKAIDLDREVRKKSPTFNPKEDHDSGAYLDSLGWVLYKQKKNAEAKDWLIKAIEDKSGQHIEIFDHLGDVYLALGDRKEAIGAWEKGLKSASESRRDQERKTIVEKKLEKAKSSK